MTSPNLAVVRVVCVTVAMFVCYIQYVGAGSAAAS